MANLTNNREFLIRSRWDFDNLHLDIVTNGYDVASTREFTNVKLIVPGLWPFDHDTKWGALGAKIDNVREVMWAINHQDDEKVNEVYESKYYTFLKESIEKAAQWFKDDSTSTRRASLVFPDTHCFQSLQVMLRDDEMFVTVNMRSCNLVKNLMSDLCLAYKLSVLMAVNYINASTHVTLTANIGSLHIFKEDFSYVLRNA